MNCRTLFALALLVTVACAGTADPDPEAEPVRPMEPVETTDKLTEPAGNPAALEGGEWTLLAMGADDKVADDISITWKFDGGNLSGRSGCNLYQSTMVLDGAAVTMDRIASTKRACPPPVMETESAFLAALAGVESWRMDGDRLHLDYETADGDTGTLVFERSGEG